MLPGLLLQIGTVNIDSGGDRGSSYRNTCPVRGERACNYVDGATCPPISHWGD